MKGATVENSAIAMSALKISKVPMSGTSQNFLRSLAKPHRSLNKSSIVRLSPSGGQQIQKGFSILCGGRGGLGTREVSHLGWKPRFIRSLPQMHSTVLYAV